MWVEPHYCVSQPIDYKFIYFAYPCMGLHFTVLIIHYACFPHTYLNHAFVYFNQISANMYPLHVKEFTN